MTNAEFEEYLHLDPKQVSTIRAAIANVAGPVAAPAPPKPAAPAKTLLSSVSWADIDDDDNDVDALVGDRGASAEGDAGSG